MLHIETLSPLYEDVQLSGIFPDSKFFVDASPKIEVSQLLVFYAQEKNKREFNLHI